MTYYLDGAVKPSLIGSICPRFKKSQFPEITEVQILANGRLFFRMIELSPEFLKTVLVWYGKAFGYSNSPSCCFLLSAY